MGLLDDIKDKAADIAGDKDLQERAEKLAQENGIPVPDAVKQLLDKDGK